jgi:two-component system sensor histidine kinase MprB
VRARSLSSRLTIAAIAAVALAVILFGIAARVVIGERMHDSLDDSLRNRATDVARLSVSAPAVLSAPGALEAPVSGRQLSVEVLDRDGAIVARSLSLGARLLPRVPAVEAAAAGDPGYADAELGSEPIRLFAAPIADIGGPAAGGVVLVASSTADIEDTQHRLGLLLLLCGAGAVLVGGGAAALLARRSTRPLRELSNSAATIERTEDSSRRLAEPAGPAEIAELAGTLNRMLDALDASRERERRFLADASHELRTPLTSLRGNVEYLARHGLDPEALADLEADAERLRRLVDDLLALERGSAAGAPRGPLRLDQAVREAAAGRERVEVAIEAEATVAGEADAIARALGNLLDNAELHGPDEGRVEIALRVADGRARVVVSDEGPGFAAGSEEAAFERFWRGSEAIGSPGSGLGLAIVRAIAERHGGRAWAEGSTVSIELPLSGE